MGYTQKLGLLAQSVFQDSSLNVGIGGSPSGSYKLEVTGKLSVANTYALDPLIRLATTTSGNVEVQMRTATTTYNAGIGVVTSGYDFGLFTNNTTRMTITSAGNIGIGTTPPTNNGGTNLWLGGTGSINDDGASFYAGIHNAYYNSGWKYLKSSINAQYYLQDDVGNHIWANAPSGTANGAITFTERMRITSGGNVGIGTTSPTNGLLQVYATSGNTLSLQKASGAAAVAFGSASSDFALLESISGGGLIFYTGNGSLSERMRITSEGYLKASNFSSYTSYFGNYHQFFQNISGDWIAEFANYNSVPYGLLIRYGAAAPRAGGNQIVYIVDTSGTVFSMTSNGNCYNLNNVYTALSDIKLKENIVDASPKLDKLLQVRIRNFNLKTDPNLKQIGVIAQELQEIFPGLVEEIADRNTDGKLNGETSLGVKYSVFVPMIIKAMQEQQVIIEDLKSRLDKAGL